MDTRTKFSAHLIRIGCVHTLHGCWIRSGRSGRHWTNNFCIKRHDDVTLAATSTMAATRVVGVSTGASDSHSQSHSFPPKPFYPSKRFAFPVRKFGSKGEKRSSLADWCSWYMYDWLHYDHVADAAFCFFVYESRAWKNFMASTKQDPAFISGGYTNWKDATTAFNSHLASHCHKEAVEVDKLPGQTGNVGERLVTEHEQQKAESRTMFKRILQTLHFLAREAWLWGAMETVMIVILRSYCVVTSIRLTRCTHMDGKKETNIRQAIFRTNVCK